MTPLVEPCPGQSSRSEPPTPKLGIKLHPHKLRHTFTTDLLNNGGSVADLQRILGHESAQMSLYYAHVTNTDAVGHQKSNSMVDHQLRRRK